MIHIIYASLSVRPVLLNRCWRDENILMTHYYYRNDWLLYKCLFKMTNNDRRWIADFSQFRNSLLGTFLPTSNNLIKKYCLCTQWNIFLVSSLSFDLPIGFCAWDYFVQSHDVLGFNGRVSKKRVMYSYTGFRAQNLR